MGLSKAVMSKSEADRVAVTFSPRKFAHVVSKTAHEFVAFNTQKAHANGTGQTSFRIDRIVAEQTGVAELERLSLEEKVEREALLRMKEFQEQAFQQAYQLGLEEGRERAFVESSAELKEQLQHLQELVSSVESIKTDLVACNETQIVRLVFYLAKRLVFQEIAVKPEIILEVVSQALRSAQSDEKVTIRISARDFQFIESVRDTLGKEYEALKRARFESSDEIASGGCMVETNYGDVNATLEQRLDRIWTSIAEKLPKIQNKIGHSAGDEGGSGGETGDSGAGV